MVKNRSHKKQVVIITGCAGFIGSAFTQAYIQQFPDNTVIGIDNLSTGKRSSVPASIRFYQKDITDKKSLLTIFRKHKPVYVFHFAALPSVAQSVQEPSTTSLTNVQGTINLLEVSRDTKVKRFIYSSSAAVYGNTDKHPTRESQLPNPQTPYALQKYTGELFCKLFSTLYELDTVCLRYFNVFGPGQRGNAPYATVIAAWLEALYFPKNKKAFLEGDGSQTRDFCYIDNIIQANICAMKTKKFLNGNAYNIGGGKETSLQTIRTLIEHLSGKSLFLEIRPPRLGDIYRSYASIIRAKRDLHYKPDINIQASLTKTIAWFEKQK